MIPVVCKTCGKLLAHISVLYEKGLKMIDDNNEKSEEQKKKMKSRLITKLGINRYCCRINVLTFIPLIKYIIY